MKKIFMYGHGGSENHGCEAIVRSTIQILGDHQYCLISSNPDEDFKYGLDQLCDIIPEKNSIHKNDPEFVKALIKLKLKKDYVSMDKLQYKDSFGKMKYGDIALSIGGDNYCYADVNRYIMMHDLAIKKGAVTILWGCSIEPELITNPHIAKDLGRYDYIFARESITYEAVKTINKNTVFMPDTAFLLKKEECSIPEGIVPQKTIGINISPMVIKNEKEHGVVLQNYLSLIDYIIHETDYNIALIPHVVWEDSNDFDALNVLFERYKDTGRVVLVENQSCGKLKNLISKCSYFIGARTHSTIAAYSNGIPTIVVGYSVKAIGIARDIFGTDDNFVLSSSDLSNKDELLNAFIALRENEKTIKKQIRNYTDSLPSQYEVIHRFSVFGE